MLQHFQDVKFPDLQAFFWIRGVSRFISFFLNFAALNKGSAMQILIEIREFQKMQLIRRTNVGNQF